MLPEVYKGLHKPPEGRKPDKHGFRSNRLQNPRGNNPQQPNTMLRTIEAP